MVGSVRLVSALSVQDVLRPKTRVSSWRGRVGVVLAVVMVATMVQAVETPSRADAAPAGVDCPGSRPDQLAASVSARMCGGPVLVSSLTSETTQVWAQPDGQMHAEQTQAPERFRDPDGTWRQVNLTLITHQDGSVSPIAHPRGLVLSGPAENGDHDLARVNAGHGQVGLGWHGSLPTPILDGTRATYPNVQPGIDVVVEATRTSFETYLVVDNRIAALGLSSVSMPWTTTGLATTALTAVATEDGGLDLKDVKGDVAATVPAAQMWDATVDDDADIHPHHSQAALSTRRQGDGTDLVVTPDAEFLADPATVYPVTIDPSPGTPTGADFDAFIESDLTSDQSGSTELRIGTFDSGTTLARSFLSWHNLNYLWGSTITSATLKLYNFHSFTCGSTLSWKAYRYPSVNNTVRWSNQQSVIGITPGSSNDTHGNTGCAADWSYIPVTDAFQNTANGGSFTANVELRSGNESSNSYWKKFDSMEGTHQPSVSVYWNFKPVVAARNTVPATACATGSSRPYVSSTTPTLTATVTDAEAAPSSVKFEWWQVGGGSALGNTTVSNVPSGGTATAAITTTLTNGTNYQWRVQPNDGTSTPTWSPYCEFTVDTVAPSAAPGVSGSPYTAGSWQGSAGTAGTFTLTAGGVSDVASYLYDLDQNPPTTPVDAATLGGSAAPSITPPTDGPHTLYVQSRDRAGNLSAVTSYAFYVGTASVTNPKAGDVSAAKFPLEAAGQSGTTGVTYQWRRGDADSWTTIPTGDVTVAAGGGPVTWPQLPTSTGSGVYAKLNWDVAATLNAAEAGPDPLAGPVQVRAVFSTVTSTSDPVKVTFDPNLATAASVQVGPGSVNLLTGATSISEGDASAFGLALGRTYNTRQYGVVDPMFGPGWASTASLTGEDAGYTGLTVIGSLVQIGVPDSAVLGFTKTSVAGGTTTYSPQVGAEGMTLTSTTSPDQFTLTETDGTVVVFTPPAGAPTGAYAPTSVTPAGSSEATTASWVKVTLGGVDVLRPTRLLAPVASGVTCTTLVAGCRALSFTYASATTATGTSSSQWGDYAGRVSQVSFTGWDPDGSPAAMATVVVEKYAYDSNGYLRAAWDPRLDWTDPGPPSTLRHVGPTYDYDTDGILTTITPAGLDPWTLAFTTIPNDSGKGRLATVSRSALSAGTAVTTVVYKVPVSGSGAPYDLSSSQTPRWAQTEAPVDATAVYPPTAIPTGNQAAGTMPSSYAYATISYLDANARPVNTADANGGVDTTWYDTFGHVVRTLTAGNRKRALDYSVSDSTATEASLSLYRSDKSVYSSDGTQLLSTLGPEHDVALTDGSTVRGRVITTFKYDEGATGGPYNLVTTQEDGVQYTNGIGAQVVTDKRKTTTDYDWTLLAPTTSTVDPAGLALATRTTYDSATKQVATVTAPAGGATTNTPATTKTIYYTAASNATYTECGNHAEWAELVCRTQPGGQAATGPEIPVKVTTYDLYGSPRTQVEKTSAGTQRTTTITYDAAARPSTVATSTASGLGTAVPTTRTTYDPATGLILRTQSLDPSNNVTAEVIRAYDALGRTSTYTDADGNTSTTTYDIASRIDTNSDGKATRTYTYDGGSERRGLATQVYDSRAGTLTAGYDTDRNIISQTWPDSIAIATSVNEAGDAVSITYTQSSCGQPDCTLYAETVATTAHGQWSSRQSTLSDQTYSYDANGRLTTVQDTVGGACTTRIYAFAGTPGAAGDRTGLNTYGPASDGTCQSTTADTSRSYSFDTADRITTSGTVYDDLGRTKTQAAADTLIPSTGNITSTYFTNDMTRTVAQNGRTTTYTLDVLANRVRSWTDNGTGTLVSRTNHYANDADVAAWTDEGNSTWSRVLPSVYGSAGIDYGPTSGSIMWQIVNLHGDFVGGVASGTAGLAYTSETNEYGQPRNAADIGARRYSWLGAVQRAADVPGGFVLMGSRAYNPATGRLSSVDAVAGGNANAYDYCGGDPGNCTDLDGKFRRTVLCKRAYDYHGGPVGVYSRTCYFSLYFNPYESFALKLGFTTWLLAVALASTIIGASAGVVGGIVAFLVAFVAASYAWDYIKETLFNFHRCVLVFGRYGIGDRRLYYAWASLYGC